MSRFEGVKITWYGHAAFRFVSPKGKVIWIDPWLEHPLAPPASKDMEQADLILVTHGHSDHLGNTVTLAQKTGALVVSIYEIMLFLQKKGLTNLQGMNKGGTLEWEGLRITMTDATHSSGIDVDGNVVPGGEAAGYIVTFENGFKVYHAGDTGLFGGLAMIGDFYRPDLVCLPIGSLFTMGPEEAAYAVTLLKPRWIIPMHYKTFPVLTGQPEALIKALPDEYKDRVIVLQPGETVE